MQSSLCQRGPAYLCNCMTWQVTKKGLEERGTKQEQQNAYTRNKVLNQKPRARDTSDWHINWPPSSKQNQNCWNKKAKPRFTDMLNCWKLKEMLSAHVFFSIVCSSQTGTCLDRKISDWNMFVPLRVAPVSNHGLALWMSLPFACSSLTFPADATELEGQRGFLGRPTTKWHWKKVLKHHLPDC